MNPWEAFMPRTEHVAPEPLVFVRPMSDLDGLDDKTLKALTKMSKALQPELHATFEARLKSLHPSSKSKE